MTREVDLVSYLPPFMAEYKEISTALEAENPEFKIVWDAAERVLKNEFIETADEYGISRFEALLGILPSSAEDLESRRSRVMSRWYNETPYTLKMLISKLAALCGESDFTVTKNYGYYEIAITTSLELLGQVEELKRIIDGVIPCNMRVTSENTIECAAFGSVFAGGAVSVSETFFVTDAARYDIDLQGGKAGAGLEYTEIIGI